MDHRSDILKQLELYGTSQLITDEEKAELPQYISFIESNLHCLERTNRGHVTGSAWIVNHDFSKALLTHHKKLNDWFQLGGHADGDPNIKRVALKEAQEESGINEFSFVISGIFDIDLHPIPGPCEYHYDIRYLLQTFLGATFTVSHESHDLAWLDLDKIHEYSFVPSVLRLAEKSVLVRDTLLKKEFRTS